MESKTRKISSRIPVISGRRSALLALWAALLVPPAHAADGPTASGGLVDPGFVTRHVKLLPLLGDGPRAMAEPAAGPRGRLPGGALDHALMLPGAPQLTIPLFDHGSLGLSLDGPSIDFQLSTTRQAAPVRSQVKAALARLTVQLLDGAF